MLLNWAYICYTGGKSFLMQKYLFSVLLACLFGFGSVFGAPHDYDLTFKTIDQDGSIYGTASSVNASVFSVVRTPDGKLLIG